jgi:hypothetical protein
MGELSEKRHALKYVWKAQTVHGASYKHFGICSYLQKIKSFLSSFRLGEQGLYPELSPTKFLA